jgi:hypothetical protein
MNEKIVAESGTAREEQTSKSKFVEQPSQNLEQQNQNLGHEKRHGK